VCGRDNGYTSLGGLPDILSADQLKFDDVWGSHLAYPHIAVPWTWAFDTWPAPGISRRSYFSLNPVASICAALIWITSTLSGIGTRGMSVESVGTETIVSTTSMPLMTCPYTT
jgi:hypothetical protein